MVEKIERISYSCSKCHREFLSREEAENHEVSCGQPKFWKHEGENNKFPIRTVLHYEGKSFQQPCLVQACLEAQRKRGITNPVAMIVCSCPRCRIYL